MQKTWTRTKLPPLDLSRPSDRFASSCAVFVVGLEPPAGVESNEPSRESGFASEPQTTDDRNRTKPANDSKRPVAAGCPMTVPRVWGIGSKMRRERKEEGKQTRRCRVALDFHSIVVNYIVQ